MPRLEDAFREIVLLKTGDDIAETDIGLTTESSKKSDAITLAILSLLTILLQQMKSDITPISETTNVSGVIPSPS